LVPVLRGIKTTLSAWSGPGAVTSRCSTVNPKNPAIAAATRSVRKPLRAASIPPRRRRRRGGGAGAAIGLIASLGLRGAQRGCAPGAGASVEGGGVVFFLPNIATCRVAEAPFACRRLP
jgi:hypothetical protein